MTEPTRARQVECLRCGQWFAPRKAGHVFCSPDCRHRGERKPEQCAAADRAAVERLFDDRPDSERVAPDEWFPPPAPPGWVKLYAGDTLGGRRRWYRNLVERGRL